MDEPAKSISKKHSVCKQVLAVLTVLCALGGVMYATGVGKHIHEALNQMITPEQKSNLQRRRYDYIRLFKHILMFGKYFDSTFVFCQSLFTKQILIIRNTHHRFRYEETIFTFPKIN